MFDFMQLSTLSETLQNYTKHNIFISTKAVEKILNEKLYSQKWVVKACQIN